ncbi:MAG: hypothetical protein ACJAS4_003229 [Bacteriovoracaceae bacterium]|jgi:uncharacterized protein involved in response to NO
MLKMINKAPIFSNSIRVFFPLAALIAVLVPMYTVTTIVNSYPFINPHFSIYEWHGFEMIFGFFYTLLIGFILTAGAHWTNKEPTQGAALIQLLVLWTLDQVAILFSSSIYFPMATSLLLGLLLIKLVASLLSGYRQKWIFIIAVFILTTLKVLFIYGAKQRGFIYKDTLYGLGTWVYVLLTIIIGGRVTPNFTKNFFKLEKELKAPTLLNKVSILFTALIVVTTFSHNIYLNSGIYLISGVTSMAKIYFWLPLKSLKHPIIGMLHIGYFVLSTSLIIKAFSYHFESLDYTRASLHLLLTGGVSIMALNIMVRATLGHTGRPINMSITIGIMYISIIVGMLIRFLVPIISPEHFTKSLHHSMGFWTFAFLLYLIKFIPIVFRMKINDK